MYFEKCTYALKNQPNLSLAFLCSAARVSKERSLFDKFAESGLTEENRGRGNKTGKGDRKDAMLGKRVSEQPVWQAWQPREYKEESGVGIDGRKNMSTKINNKGRDWRI